MAQNYIHEIEVEGSFTFPIDMLRYDGLYPATGKDSSEISLSLQEIDTTIKKYTLRTNNSKNWVPTLRRWQSFGFKVISHIRIESNGNVKRIID